MFEHSIPVAEVPDWLELEHAAQPLDPWTDADVLRSAASRPAGPGLLLDLMQIDPAALSPDDAVILAQQVDRLVAFSAGLQAKVRDEVNRRLIQHGVEVDAGLTAKRSGSTFATPQMLASAELASALRLSPRSMDAQLERAVALAGPLAALRDAMLAGELSAGHAAAIDRELHRLPAAADPALDRQFTKQCADLLAVVIPYAQTHTPGQTARRTRLLVAAADPAGAEDRRRRAAELEHGVWLSSIDTGTCQITAVMPTAHGQAVMSAITTLARDPRFETADGCVTAGQRRVAAIVALMLGEPGTVSRVEGPVSEAKITAHVTVIVPAESLTDRDAAAARGGSIGHEPASAHVIRDLLADASPASTLRRLTMDSAGCIVDAGRTRYSISDAQRSLIALRDGTCRFPGCSRRAARCEVDHAVPWDDGGATDLANLGALCKHHHQLKTHGGWRITRSERSGACTWRSPLGRIYQHDPPALLPPVPQPLVPAVEAEPPPF